jgi:hypothetical protein
MVASFLMRAGVLVTEVVSPTVTWDPSNKSSIFDLSGGNLTVTSNATGTNGNGYHVRATTSKSTGKWHYEIDNNSMEGGAGFCNSSFVLDNTYMGQDGNSFGLYPNGDVTINDVNVTNVGSFGSTGTVAIEIDIDAELVWFSINGGDWNNSGTANPATGTGGISYAAVNSGPWFPVLYGYPSASSQATVGIFTNTGLSKAISSGFAAWG